MDITPQQPAPTSPTEKRKTGSTISASSNNKKKHRNKPAESPKPTPVVATPTPPTESAPATPADMGVQATEAVEELLQEDMNGMIATAAYYLAERRNFAPGHEVEDWLEAEQQLRR